MDALIKLCSYFGAEEGESGAGLQFGGLEEWSAHHVALHKQRLAHLQTIRIPQLALELEKLGAVDGAASWPARHKCPPDRDQAEEGQRG